ncbi:MAG: DUF1697 domain-containing protein [Deltaproteobacteria bacterium]
MKNLVEIPEGMGCEKVITYIQSGIQCSGPGKTKQKKIAEEISSRIMERHGFKLKVLPLRVSELEEAIENNPFRTRDGKALHFFFLESTPIKPDLGELVNLKSNSEEF